MMKFAKVLAALGLGLGLALGYAGRSNAEQSPITAIDIALEPDATMIQHAEAINERLMKVFPKGSPSARRITSTSRFCNGTCAPRTSKRSTPRPGRFWRMKSRLAGN